MARPPGFYESLRETHEKVRAEQFTWDDVRNNPWAVVDLPIPRDADTDLLSQARNVAKYYCLDQISRSIECDGARNDPTYPPGYIDERLEKTTGRLAELDGRLAERQQPEHSDDLEARTERALQEARAAAKGLTGDIPAAEPAPGVERPPERPEDHPGDRFHWTDSPRMDQQQRSALDWIRESHERRARQAGEAENAPAEKAIDDIDNVPIRDDQTAEPAAPDDERSRPAEEPENERDARREGGPREITDREREFYDRYPGLTRDDETEREHGQDGHGGRGRDMDGE